MSTIFSECVISLLWTLYVFSPFNLAYLSYIFCKTVRPWNYLFIPLPDQCPCCHDKRRKWDKFTDQAKGQISRLKIFIQSENLSGIEKGSLKKLVQIIESVFLSRWCDTSQSENTRFGKLDILRYRLLVLIFTIRLGGSAQYSAVL